MLHRSSQLLFSQHSGQLVAAASGGSEPSLSLLSWSVDASERSMHGAMRRSPFAERMPHILRAIARVSPDVLCLQDSSPELAAALSCGTPAFQLVISTRNGLYGELQTYVRSSSAWGATAREQYSFACVDLDTHSGRRLDARQRIRIVNSDWVYRGKRTVDTDPFALPAAVAAHESCSKRSLVAGYLSAVVHPHIVVGNVPMSTSESIDAVRFHDLVGVSGRASMTTDTLPMRKKGSLDSVQHETNFFYFANPTFVANRTKQNDPLSTTTPCVHSGAALPRENARECTSLLGRYQRCFLRRGSSAESSVMSRPYRVVTSSVLRPMHTLRVSQPFPSSNSTSSVGEVLVGCSDQFPLLVQLI